MSNRKRQRWAAAPDLDHLFAPYWAHKGTDLPGTDFTREIIEPGTNATFPDGVLDIRVDGDFWAVAALPLSFKTTPLWQIVEKLWPSLAAEADYPQTPEYT